MRSILIVLTLAVPMLANANRRIVGAGMFMYKDLPCQNQINKLLVKLGRDEIQKYSFVDTHGNKSDFGTMLSERFNRMNMSVRTYKLMSDVCKEDELSERCAKAANAHYGAGILEGKFCSSETECPVIFEGQDKYGPDSLNRIHILVGPVQLSMNEDKCLPERISDQSCATLQEANLPSFHLCSGAKAATAEETRSGRAFEDLNEKNFGLPQAIKDYFSPPATK